MQFEQIAIAVTETSQVGEARRAMASLSAATTLEETDQGRAAIVTSELAANLVRHARGGMILMRALGSGDGIELIALDRGPGMADVERCLRDGFSTGGTPGTGLGAVRRLSNEFDLHSSVPTGTVVVARVLDSRQRAIPRSARLPWGGICVPLSGEQFTGDSLSVVNGETNVSLMVAGGLGNGTAADEAAGWTADLFSR